MLLTGRRSRKRQEMKRAIVVMTGVMLLSSGLSAAAKEERITGYVKSIDSQARKITLSDDATFPLNPDADTSWLQPGMKVDLICQYDALGVVGCGVGFASLSKDLNQETNEQDTNTGTGFSADTGYATPDTLLPDTRTQRLRHLIPEIDK
jgi:Protein of unknown function (DUF1344)